MASKVLICICVTLAVATASVVTPGLRSDPVGPVVVHATENSTVPSVDYIVNGVECLKQAIEVFPDEGNVAKLYAALFKTKYPDHTWNVAVGYTTLCINTSIKVEVSVSNGKQFSGKLKGDKKSKDTLYMIFSSD